MKCSLRYRASLPDASGGTCGSRAIGEFMDRFALFRADRKTIGVILAYLQNNLYNVRCVLECVTL
jgi:hypothetical protein